MNGAATLAKNFRRQGIRSKLNGKPNPLHPHDRRSTDTLAAGEYATAVVDDPYEQGGKLSTLRQLRNDPLARLHSHRQIDDAQFHAGRAYQNDREVAERGAQAIDPSKEAVDGGKAPEALTDRQIKARKRLIKIERDLGRRLMSVLEDVLIEGRTIEQVSQSKAQSVLKLHGGLFRVALNELATIYCFSNGEPVESES
ncbi:hypothetical protein IVB34_12705 [Bradyrhizobium sp. 2]|uniref:DUF6456 domain-containing protein n=1 Tax=Bradyrhizobium sp. 2 TaxID=190045 RepID=UPI001FFB2150|nr:DUF6456 domain-containing protein [Bradyrhizobium sp. 2]MCK1459215.1 hypothetical protein [Bradyrhizobium sp. 2]